MWSIIAPDYMGSEHSQSDNHVMYIGMMVVAWQTKFLRAHILKHRWNMWWLDNSG